MAKRKPILNDSNEAFKKIYLNSPIAIELYDSKGKMVEVNQTCLDLFGISDPSQIQDFNLFKDPNIPVKEIEKLKKGISVRFESSVDFGKVKELNLYETTKLGIIFLDILITPISFENNVRIDNYLVQVLDITEKKKLEENLKKSEEKFKELFNNMRSGVAIYEAINNGKDFIFKQFNVAGEKIDNVKKEDLIGKRVVKIFPGIKKFGLLDVFQRVWKTSKAEHHPITLYKDKRLIGWRENYVYKLSSGEIVAVYDDITERMVTLDKLKLSEENLKKLNEELEQKVEERTNDLKKSEEKYRKAYEDVIFYKDLFTHDIRNILTVISTSADIFSQYIKGSIKLNDVEKILENISKQVDRGVKLIAYVQKLSELEQINNSLQKIDLSAFLESAITYIKNSYLSKKLNIQLITPGKKYFVKGNDLLQDVFENILINAINYNDNPIITIIINIFTEHRAGKDFVKILFIDNGIGVEDQKKETIFQRTSRNLKGAKGMGLGLALVKKIIESYNGQIWVEDKIKGDYTQGSQFIILIPEAI